MPGLGEELRAAREARNLSLSDVSEQIHIRSVYLQSIEDEKWTAIAAPVYVRGFIRTYARFLGIDPEGAVERFNASLGPGEAAAARTPGIPAAGRRGPSVWLLLAGAAAVVLVAFVGYSYYQWQNASGGPGAQQGALAQHPAKAAPPIPTAAPPAVRPSATVRALELRLTQRSWLLVEVDGVKVLEGILPAGWRGDFHGKTVVVRAGNAGGVEPSLNGKDLGTMGAPGDVVQKTYTLAQE